MGKEGFPEKNLPTGMDGTGRVGVEAIKKI
jgi:hypothetical protein